ncbi:MAG: Hpt domain-containing protein [Deltaproteobacteria bacterium]|nr:Hpt domain-containing protein [Deltaproteobacteria bacterium]
MVEKVISQQCEAERAHSDRARRGADQAASVEPERFTLDLPKILARFDGDVDFFREIAQLFIDDCPKRLAALHAAIAAGDSLAIQNVAHSLKGSVSSFDAEAAHASTQRVETLARSGDLPAAAAAAAALEIQIDRLIRELNHTFRDIEATEDVDPVRSTG